MTDDPLFELVMPTPEEFPHAEERRLFYVALTRAWRVVYVLSEDRTSPFVEELARLPRVKSDLPQLDECNSGRPCPECHQLVIGGAKKGKNHRSALDSSPSECPSMASTPHSAVQ